MNNNQISKEIFFNRVTSQITLFYTGDSSFRPDKSGLQTNDNIS